jgi:hypothetical protein
MQSVKAPFRAVFIEARMASERQVASRSGGELLAAARSARREHPAAADRRRAGAKAVTALAHELAGLIGPLHGLVSEFQSSAESRAPPDLKPTNANSAPVVENQAAGQKNECGAFPRR